MIQYDKGDTVLWRGLGYVAECAWSSAVLQAPSRELCLQRSHHRLGPQAQAPPPNTMQSIHFSKPRNNLVLFSKYQHG